jgi:hypothetical protein
METWRQACPGCWRSTSTSEQAHSRIAAIWATRTAFEGALIAAWLMTRLSYLRDEYHGCRAITARDRGTGGSTVHDSGNFLRRGAAPISAVKSPQ